ncbi:MAG: M42 family metallopeptidase [Thermotogota bacterium]|nr:M42 family metallopeptidase [Thermotogota bacterium]
MLLSAHIDTLGAMVKAVKDNGRIRITKLGGFPENNIEGENCIIHTREGRTYSGTIQLNHSSVHVYDDVNTIKRDNTTVEVVIDKLVKTADDTETLGIMSGDFISFDPRTVVTESGFIKSRHLDDKASVAILIELAKAVKEEKLKLSRRVELLFTNYEEVGHGASTGIPNDIDEMIAVDMGAVGDDLKTDETCVSICAKDSNGPYDYLLTTKLIKIAKEKNLNFAVDSYPRYGSDAGAALRSGMDAAFALIGPGVSASHGYERTHKAGLENTYKLLLELI